ncbi:MAG: aldolase/citrate lyase family protein [Spirochaetota bacterium]
MQINIIKSFKEKIKNGAVFGPFSKTSDPAFIEILGLAGFDFVVLDMEHGPNSLETVQNLIRAAELTGLFPVVRVEENNFSQIGRALDIGAGAIQVPQVRSVDDVKKVLHYAKFASEGMRGVCRFVRAAAYSAKPREDYFKDANRALVIIQLEGKEAVENLDDILEFGGFDVLFIGPYDLSQSLGISGQVDHPLVEEKIVEIVKRSHIKKVQVGIFTDTLGSALKWVKAGVRYLSYSVDVGLYFDACRTIIQQLSSRKV